VHVYWDLEGASCCETKYGVQNPHQVYNKEHGGPIDPGKPYGLLAKTGDWLWSDSESQRCYAPGIGIPVTPYQSTNSAGWQILEGSLNSGASDFLPNFFLVMENISQGTAFVDYVAIEEILGATGMVPTLFRNRGWLTTCTSNKETPMLRQAAETRERSRRLFESGRPGEKRPHRESHRLQR